MTEEWKALNEDGRNKYVLLSNREKDRYGKEMKVFKEKVAKETALENEKNPKKPKSPFFCYVKARYQEAKAENKDKPHKELMQVSCFLIE